VGEWPLTVPPPSIAAWTFCTSSGNRPVG
jgi:hypothetical protein